LILLAGAVSLLIAPPARTQDETAARAAFDRGLALFREAQELARTRPASRDESARKHLEAAASFVAAWKVGAATTEVFTNAANAYAFAGRTGEAVLFYRRALAVDPGNRRARDALEHLRSGLPIRRQAGGAGTSIARSLFFWHEGMSFRDRRTAFVALLVGACAAFGAALFRRRPFFSLGLLFLLPALALLGSLATEAFGSSLRDDAVLLVAVEGRRGDGLTYSPSHSRPLPPGTELTCLRTPREAAAGGEAWVLGRLLDGSETWLPARTLEKVLP
jgi:tetratricopeptide (TPR) repeat protein